MNNLPPEILQIIFYPLHQLDKVECMTVCRSWKRVLETTNLCQVVRLQSNIQLNKLIKKMEQEPYQRQKVEQLIIEAPNIGLSAINQQPFLFSNVKKIVLCNESYAINHSFANMLPFNTWSRTIEYIYDVTSHLLAYDILKGGVCPVLREIHISGQYLNDRTKFIPLLENAPALKVLVIEKFNLKLTDLELLHEAVPLLSSLSFSFDSLALNPNSTPTNIEPATSVTRLLVHTSLFLSTETYVAFLKYLTDKYTRIRHMGSYIYMSYTCNINDCMTMGLKPHIQQIAPHLTSLKIHDSRCFRDIFQELDQNDCRLKELTLHRVSKEREMISVVQSNQAQFIQNLTIIIVDDIFRIHLSNFSALTKLHIIHQIRRTYQREGLNINQQLQDTRNTLMTLKLENTWISLDRSAIQSYPILKTLVLKNITLPTSVDFFITQTFPHLRTLIIDDCAENVHSFYLAGLDLSYLEFKGRFSKEDDHILIVTLCNNENRWYCSNKASNYGRNPSGQLVEYPAMKSLPFEEYNGLPHTTFICNSLFSFFMVNTSS